MDLTAALTNIQHAKTVSGVQIRVARKLMDAQQLQGAAMVRLIEAVGDMAARAGDSLTAAATGLGGKIDVRA
jgi:hypothetical protein